MKTVSAKGAVRKMPNGQLNGTALNQATFLEKHTPLVLCFRDLFPWQRALMLCMFRDASTPLIVPVARPCRPPSLGEDTGHGNYPASALQEFAPTIMIGVPKIWDALKKKTAAAVAK